MSKPNVWFIMVDQLRWDAMGCYGNDIVETAHLDQIASQGTVFENCYTPAPRCVPARTSLISSKNPWHTGSMYPDPDKHGIIDPGTTLPQLFGEAGYHTQSIGGVGVPPRRSLHGYHDVRDYALSSAVDSDYQYWFNQHKPAEYIPNDEGMGPNSWISRPWDLPEHLHPVAWTAQESVRFLERRDPTKPFFLKTSFVRPHAPYDPPAYYFNLYDEMDLPEPITGNDWDEIYNIPTSDVNAQSGRIKPRQQHRAKAGYYGLIHFIDHQIGVILQKLRKSRQLDNTIIVFTSDHGDMMGDHFMRRKCLPYEGSAHIPLLVSLPPSIAEKVRSRSDTPVSLLDIMPTLLDACGLETPADLDGDSVVPVMRGEKEFCHDYVHGEHTLIGAMNFEHHFITDGKWKYIWLTQTNEEQLFDLVNDPYEKNDLASSSEHAAELEKWRARMIADLESRNAGLVENGKLVCQKGKPRPISPHYKIKEDVPAS